MNVPSSEHKLVKTKRNLVKTKCTAWCSLNREQPCLPYVCLYEGRIVCVFLGDAQDTARQVTLGPVNSPSSVL